MSQSRNSLAYDFQEPFRFLVDLVAISLVESGAMESKDFIRTENIRTENIRTENIRTENIRTENCSLKLKPTGARKIVNEFFQYAE
jgi:CRISPR-associated protein Cas1